MSRLRALGLVAAALLLGDAATIVRPAWGRLETESRATQKSCRGESATIVGSSRADELSGTSGRDVIVAGAGDDRINSLGGPDLICAGAGEDFVLPGSGPDNIAGGRDDDYLSGGRGADLLKTGRGVLEPLFGGAGDDRLFGGPGRFDSLIGGPGDDVMDGGGGLDTAEFWESPRGVRVDLRVDLAEGRGKDSLIAIEGVVGSNYDDVLDGDDGSNRLVGQEGDDIIRAYGSGTLEDATGDIVSGDRGDDLLDGGSGADVLDYDDSIRRVVVDLEAGTSASEGDGFDEIRGFEAVIGSDFDDDIHGDAGDNAFAGGPGDDILDGGAGTDEAAFFTALAPVVVDLAAGTAEGSGSDQLIDIENLAGSAGDDSLAGDHNANVIAGGSGSDAMDGRVGDDTLVGAGGDDHAEGGEGVDACDAETESSCETDPTRRDRGHVHATWFLESSEVRSRGWDDGRS